VIEYLGKMSQNDFARAKNGRWFESDSRHHMRLTHADDVNSLS